MAHILIVEDDAGMTLTLGLILTLNDHTSIVASSATEALEILSNRSFDMVITDNMMPVMSGIELIVEYRKRGYNAPIILVTAIQTCDSKADCVIYKPFDIDGFLKIIEDNLCVPKAA